MAANLQTKQTTTLQAFSYQGVIPPPEMMERFKKLDPNLPERIVRMAEKSMDRADKELEVLPKGHFIHLFCQCFFRRENAWYKISLI